ncbi:transcriptional regulator [Tardiphaga sp.]|jgi:DNA-binding transcriptional ArsR family regulator|uniref:ArsR/SmtB family transcription factor n=1 Tax=Tardiphaga sp. TaxID=1926292 RepID=UPI0019C495D2|nr:transcriptional regulator [Tardiphaga sp.]MBC7576019.1 winged helix-turn-helix transcriptional regulator [Tardiphaga sp.]
MSRTPAHPARDQIQLPLVLDCLSDPTRLAIVCSLAGHDQSAADLRCGDFTGFSGKSNLAYHFARLREAGLVMTRVKGTARYITLRRDDLAARFPGLLDTVIKSAMADMEPWMPIGCRLVCDKVV